MESHVDLDSGSHPMMIKRTFIAVFSVLLNFAEVIRAWIIWIGGSVNH